MNYIVLDMEWNQPGYADTALCRNGVCMKNEIIQIGAVKLSENLEKTGVFECIIKPVSLTSMNRMIKQLTGITDEMIDKGESFEAAINRFREFCGDDFVILIWGYDDIRILKSNLMFHGLDITWVPANYNLQMMFSSQENLERRQYSLSFALEHFEIEPSEKLHDALNDAEYTAMVCEKLNIREGISNYKLMPSKETNDTKNSDVLIKRKFRYIRYRDDIWHNGFIVRPVCPCCGEKMRYEKPKRIGLWKINIEANCEKDGDFMVALKISETPQGTFSVNQQIYVLNENTREYFEGKKTKRSSRKRHSSRSKKKQTSVDVNNSEKESNEQI
ncbi:MAG: exonuclease domain-containing protein [Ruminococcaceae bacterium]|nr:exonuclease domain-containing protein [Oscillospiraceae bacterium]